MARKIPPVKILIHRAVELTALRHPSEKAWRNLNAALGVATLIGLAALTYLFPKVLAAVFPVAVILALIWGIKRTDQNP